jgi:DNA topoisomerase-2
MSLVNSVEGIGVGWSTTILPRNPTDVIQACTMMAASDTIDAGLEAVKQAMAESGGLKPWFYGLKKPIERSGDAKYVSRGSVVRVDDATVHITELPVGVWTDEYLAKLRESEYGVDARHTDLVVDIRVKVPVSELEDLYEELNLSTALRDGNMHGYASSGHLVKAETVYDIVRMHALERLKLYAVRLESEIQSTQAALAKAASKQKFIELVLSGSFTLYGKSKAHIQDELRALNIDTSLMSMDLWSFTLDAVHALNKDMDKMRAHVEHLKRLTPGVLWLAELKELEAAYAQFVQDREQATLVPGPTKKRPAATELSGRKGKQASKQAGKHAST